MTRDFTMFSASHLSVLAVFCIAVLMLYLLRGRLREKGERLRHVERVAAYILLAFELLYHLWMAGSGRWQLADSLPLELSSISLLAAIVLLWTGNRHLIDFVLFAGIGSAIQAMLTPVLDIDFPHFRFFHFFITHAGVILTGLYFVWVRGHVPTLKGAWKAFLMLNVLVPFIIAMNWLVGGNYMFLSNKPSSGSLLDFLGPYPWYILSLELVAALSFILIWLLLRNTAGGSGLAIKHGAKTH